MQGRCAFWSRKRDRSNLTSVRRIKLLLPNSLEHHSQFLIQILPQIHAGPDSKPKPSCSIFLVLPEPSLLNETIDAFVGIL
mmetsp:Transcript_7639/g.28644  ORF Transcript_7639/g.28644 Transcript_7639/m.28644 type:complete len:81 (-) Transcript_7639:543-785(-)